MLNAAIQTPSHTAMLHVRVDENLKNHAGHALEQMGLSMSDAVRLFLHRVVADQAFPLELKVPNAQTLAAMQESRNMMALRKERTGKQRFGSTEALFDSLEDAGRK